jgi:hypothetical protein
MALDEKLASVAAGFKKALFSYLRGSGHPVRAVGSFVSQEQADKDKGDRFVRANMLLNAATENKLLPVTQDWSIKVRHLLSYSQLKTYLLAQVPSCSCWAKRKVMDEADGESISAPVSHLRGSHRRLHGITTY